MKKLAIIISVLLIPFLTGLIIGVVGESTGDAQLAYAGKTTMFIGLFAGLAVGVVVVLALLITGKLYESNEKEKKRDRQKEYREIEEVNASRRFESERKQAEYIARHAQESYTNSDLKERVLTWTFLGFATAAFVLIIVFAFLGIWIGAIVCFAVFVGAIFVAAIGKVIIEKTSMNFGFRKSKNSEVLTGEVKACVLSSLTSVGGATGLSSTRVAGTVYKVIVTAQGKDYISYSERFYEIGEALEITIIKKRLAAINRET